MIPNMRILIAEDDDRLRSLLERALRESGYVVDAYANGEDVLFAAETSAVDLVILDIMLAGTMSGVDVCRRIREQERQVPILLLTALDSPKHRVAGLDSGADDYLTKPFHLSELLARVRALLRRSPLTVSPVLRVADIEMDIAAHTVSRFGCSVDLTAREFAVLELLMRNPQRVVSATELIDHAWDSNYEGYSNVVASTVRHLRAKLSSAGESDPIDTVRGRGYRIAERSA